MNSLNNSVRLIGRLGQDPILKKIENGKKVLRFSLATDDSYKNSNGQKVTETAWHNIVVWNGPAEVLEKYLKKGSRIALDGKIAYRSYEDKKGETRYITEIILNDFMFLDSSKGNANDSSTKNE